MSAIQTNNSTESKKLMPMPRACTMAKPAASKANNPKGQRSHSAIRAHTGTPWRTKKLAANTQAPPTTHHSKG